jgi:c-di-GMP-binding flagellar brake protein YcgR
MTDRRQEVRVEGEHRIVLNLRPDPGPGTGGTEFVGLTRDLSAGGIRVLTDAPWPIDARVAIKLVLRRPRRLISGFGRVRWVKPLYEKDVFEMGLEFTELAPEGLAAVLEHLYRAARHAA